MMLNDYGFPVFDDSDFSGGALIQKRLDSIRTDSRNMRFELAKSIAAEARARNFPPLCDCKECTAARNLPAVLRILAKWTPQGELHGND